jgi:hypothetical protein
MASPPTPLKWVLTKESWNPMGRTFSDISKFMILYWELQCFCHSQLPVVNLDGTTARNTEQPLIRDGLRNLRAPYTRQLQRRRDLWLQVYWLQRAVYGSYGLICCGTLHMKAILNWPKFIIPLLHNLVKILHLLSCRLYLSNVAPWQLIRHPRSYITLRPFLSIYVSILLLKIEPKGRHDIWLLSMTRAFSGLHALQL